MESIGIEPQKGDCSHENIAMEKYIRAGNSANNRHAIKLFFYRNVS